MKKFLLHVSIFLFPVACLAVYISVSDVDDEVRYKAIQKDCRSGSWIYRRLHEVSAEIDVAFVGSSVTMCAINDHKLQSMLNKNESNLQIVNLGICRPGVNLHWLLIRDLVQRKKPKIIFLECVQKLKAASHPHFPVLASSPGDVFGSPVNPDAAYVEDVFSFVWHRWLFARHRMLGIHPVYKDFLEDSLHSYMDVPVDVVADSVVMQRHKQKVAYYEEKPPEGFFNNLGYSTDQYSPQAYLKRIVRLCRENNVRLYFLYLPEYGTANLRPREEEFYRQQAELLIPPDTIFNSPDHFFDPLHLNEKGADKLLPWLSERISEMSVDR